MLTSKLYQFFLYRNNVTEIENSLEELIKKNEVLLTVVTFLIITIKLFFDIHSAEEANIVNLKLSAMLVSYIFLYGALLIFKDKKIAIKRPLNFANNVLIANFFIIGLIVLYLINTDYIDLNFPMLVRGVLSILFLLFVIVATIVPFIVIGNIFYEVRYKRNLIVYKIRVYLRKLYEGYPSHFFSGYEYESQVDKGIKNLVEDKIIKPIYKNRTLSGYRLTAEGLKLVESWGIERLVKITLFVSALAAIFTLISLF
jgi:hypothetical protein